MCEKYRRYVMLNVKTSLSGEIHVEADSFFFIFYSVFCARTYANVEPKTQRVTYIPIYLISLFDTTLRHIYSGSHTHTYAQNHINDELRNI